MVGEGMSAAVVLEAVCLFYDCTSIGLYNHKAGIGSTSRPSFSFTISGPEYRLTSSENSD
jgi:hypothetical protein